MSLCLSLCLSLCFAFVAKPKALTIQAFSKMGGKFLGELRLCCKPCKQSALQLVKDLTDQGSVLLPHSKRHSDFLTIWVENTRLPGLRVGESFDEELVARLLTGATKVWLSYDEDDTKALQVLKTKYSLSTLGLLGGTLYMDCTSNGKNLCDLRVVEYLYAPTKLYLNNVDDAKDDMTVDACLHLNRLLCFDHLEELHLDNFCVNFVCLHSKLLSRLKRLYLWKCNAKASSLKHLEVFSGLEVTTHLCVIYKEL
jgi:hypothetical protein